MMIIRTVLICMMLVLAQIGTIDAQKDESTRFATDVECVNDDAFKIDKFKDKKKKDKVVVGRKIHYKAKPDNGTSWKWELGSGSAAAYVPKWTMQPMDADPIDGNGKNGVVPLSDLPMSNNDFGPTNGKVRVMKNGEDGMNYEAFREVEVFYEKDEMNLNDPSMANWFYYWIDIVRPEFTVPGIKVYNVNTGQFEIGAPITFRVVYRTDGNWSWRPNIPGTGMSINYSRGNNSSDMKFFDEEFLDVDGTECNGIRKVISGYSNYDFVINLGECIGFESVTFDFSDNAPFASTTKTNVHYKGIHSFMSTVYHELEHWKLKSEWWAEGYQSVLDCDNDYIPDSFELGPIGASYGFVVGFLDKYDPNYNADNLPAFGANTHYQEERCRRAGAAARMSHDVKDWSFDVSNLFQGKKW